MKVSRVLLFALILLARITSVSAQNGYNIKVKVHGIKDTSCYLAYYYGDKQYLKDTVKVNSKGEFSFVGKENLPGGIYLIVMPDKKYFEVIVNDIQKFSLETDTSDLVKNLKIKGSEENTLFWNYLMFIQKKHDEIMPLNNLLGKVKNNKDSSEMLRKQINIINDEVKNYKKNIISKNSKTLLAKIFQASEEIEVPDPPKSIDGKIDSAFGFRYYKAHYFDNIDFTDDRLLRTPIFHQRFSNYLEKMIHPSPDSIIHESDMLVEMARPNKEMFKYVVWYITNQYAQSKIMGYDAIYVHMVRTYYMTNQAYWITPSQLQAMSERALKLEPLLIGKISPDINYLTDLNGNVVRLYDVKAKFTILIFWSPDCGHCKKEVPELYTMYQKFKDKNVAAFTASTVRDTAKTLAFIREHKLYDWMNMLDLPLQDGKYYCNFRADYDIYATPVVMLLDENKKIVAKKLSSDQIESFLDRFLNEEADKKKKETEKK